MSNHRKLLEALNVTTKLVKVILAGQPVDRVTAQRAAAIVSGNPARWDWGGSTHRVRFIRERDFRPILPWRPCWRTCCAAVLPPPPGWDEAT